MERKNPAHFLFSGACEQRLKCARRTQLNIDIFGVRQKTQEQVSAFRQRKIICATFSRITRGDNNRRGELRNRWGIQEPPTPRLRRPSRHLAFQLIEHAAEMIESKLKKVGRLAHGAGKTEIGRRG